MGVAGNVFHSLENNTLSLVIIFLTYCTKRYCIPIFWWQGEKNFVTDAMSRIHIATEPTTNIAETDLLIEAIVENMRTKHKLFTELDKAAPRYQLARD